MRISPVVSSYLNVQRNNVNKNKNVSKPEISADNNYNSSREINFTGPIDFFKLLFLSSEKLEIINARKAAKEAERAAKLFRDIIDPTLKKTETIKNNVKTFIEYFDSNAGKKFQRKIEQDLSGNFLADTTFMYKPNSIHNELLKTCNYDKNGQLLWETSYEYGKDGKLAKTINRDSNGNILHLSVYELDDSYYCPVNYIRDIDPDGNIMKNITYSMEYGKDGSTPMGMYLRSEYINTTKYIQKFIEENKLYSTFPDKLNNDFLLNSYEVKSIEKTYYPNGKTQYVNYNLRNNDAEKFGDYVLSKEIHFDENGNFSHYSLYASQAGKSGRKDFYLNGNLKRVYEENGSYSNYFEDGKTLKSVEIYDQDYKKYLISKEYYPNGQLKIDNNFTYFFGGSGSQGAPWIYSTEYSESGEIIKSLSGHQSLIMQKLGML